MTVQNLSSAKSAAGSRYDAVIMDPPSYGCGPKGEIWKIEDTVYPLIGLLRRTCPTVLFFFLVNSYTTGLQSGVLTYMLKSALKKIRPKIVESDEIGLPVSVRIWYCPAAVSGASW